MNDIENPLVSVIVLAYNHEKYISQSLESIISQKGEFSFEIVIGEDCSKDNTPEIISEYIYKYPALIRLVNSNANVGLIKNFLRCLKAAKGEYIAVCSGDDYWIDDYKLNRQITFLEKNDDYGLVYTNYSTLNDQTHLTRKDYHASSNQNIVKGYQPDHFIKGVPAVMHITCCYRKSCLTEDYYRYMDDDNILAEDFPTFLWIGFFWKVHYQKEITTMYRVHNSSLTNSHNLEQKWKFVLSHVYMRNKFIDFQSYTSINWPNTEAQINREILKFSFKTKYEITRGLEAYKQLKTGNFSNKLDKFMALALKYSFLHYPIRSLLYINRRLTT